MTAVPIAQAAQIARGGSRRFRHQEEKWAKHANEPQRKTDAASGAVCKGRTPF